MLTVSLPYLDRFLYPRKHYAGRDNLLRVTDFNQKAFRAYVDRMPFNLENQHVLVGLLQQLDINPEWDLAYVVNYTRFRSNSLASAFKITSINGVGRALTNGFYRENVREHWVLLDDSFKMYDIDELNLDDLRSVIPLWSTVLERGYTPNIERSSIINPKITDVAIIGLNLVELAVGWWMYMKENRQRDTGISAYLCKYPLFTAQLIQNQASITNILYGFFVHEKSLAELIITEEVTFNTLNEKKLLKEYLSFLINSLTGRRLLALPQMIMQMSSLYYVQYFNQDNPGKNKLFSQTAWAMEPQVLQLYAIYLSIANRMKYKVGDVNIVIERALPAIKERYKTKLEPFYGEILTALADEVLLLNKQNFK